MLILRSIVMMTTLERKNRWLPLLLLLLLLLFDFVSFWLVVLSV